MAIAPTTARQTLTLFSMRYNMLCKMFNYYAARKKLFESNAYLFLEGPPKVKTVYLCLNV